jgi:hypothetical protein
VADPRAVPDARGKAWLAIMSTLFVACKSLVVQIRAVFASDIAINHDIADIRKPISNLEAGLLPGPLYSVFCLPDANLLKILACAFGCGQKFV